MILGLAISYLAYTAYRQNQSRPMLYVAIGFILVLFVQAPLALLFIYISRTACPGCQYPRSGTRVCRSRTDSLRLVDATTRLILPVERRTQRRSGGVSAGRVSCASTV
ncbi:DUF7521 family protein (plasmid) [Haloarcula sp. NS06]|uniref:DUF7521 family protein n=1 Tax=Haloarcula sp. NS06 TaxID=3409688 RepID=UPI003DA79933